MKKTHCMKLHIVTTWFIIWQMLINASKCDALHLNPISYLPRANYQIKVLNVASMAIVEDLGVSIDDRLKFDHTLTMLQPRRTSVLLFCSEVSVPGLENYYYLHTRHMYVRPI